MRRSGGVADHRRVQVLSPDTSAIVAGRGLQHEHVERLVCNALQGVRLLPQLGRVTLRALREDAAAGVQALVADRPQSDTSLIMS
ncbi:MAG TPA: hypothetical protein VFO07_01235 [Roseiflexaceae bacterium]|nr:hypothetical protein [Roseiflexaceae bacterium]